MLLCTVSCNNQSEDLPVEANADQQTMLKVSGQVFCIPSPIEAAFFLREDGEIYAPNMMLNLTTAHQRNAKDDKALLLGAYGADLAYSAAFEDSEHTLKCLAVMRHLCEDLELNTALGAAEIAELEASLKNKDSLTIKIGRLFFKIDNYLKANQFEKLSSLILVGGWVESMYLCADRYLSGKSKALEARMVEQRAAASGLINILNSEKETTLKKQLEGLAYKYQQIPIAYKYQEPLTDSVAGITELRGEDRVDLQADKVKELAESIINVRNFFFK